MKRRTRRRRAARPAEADAEGDEAAELRAEEESAKAMEAEVPHPPGYPEPGQESAFLKRSRGGRPSIGEGLPPPKQSAGVGRKKPGRTTRAIPASVLPGVFSPPTFTPLSQRSHVSPRLRKHDDDNPPAARARAFAPLELESRRGREPSLLLLLLTGSAPRRVRRARSSPRRTRSSASTSRPWAGRAASPRCAT